MVDSVMEPLLKKAKEMEKKYEWLQATESYQKATDLALKQENPSEAAELQEQLGFSFSRAAYQAQTNIEFRKLLKRAVQAYEKESKILEGVEDVNNQVRIDHAHAGADYTRSLRETKLSKVKELADKYRRLEKKVLKAYETSGDAHSVGRTCNNLVEWTFYNSVLINKNLSKTEKDKNFRETSILAEKAIRILSKLDDKYELVRAYCSASHHYSFSTNVYEDENKTIELAQKGQDYAKKALELSKEIGDAWLIAKSYMSAQVAAQLLKLDPVSALEMAENTLKYGNITKDNLIIGHGKLGISWSTNSVAIQLEDPSKQRAEYEKSIKFAREATHNFQIINHVGGLALSCHAHSLALNFLARMETDPKIRQELLEMASKAIQEGLEQIIGRGPVALLYFTLGQNLMILSETKTDLAEKRELLQKATYYANNSFGLVEGRKERKAEPGYIMLSYVQKQLANIETNNTKKLKLLNQATISVEKYIKPIEKKKIYTQSDFGRSFHLGYRYYNLGGILRQIYFLTKEQKTLHRAIETYKKTITFYKSANLPTNLAESYWHVAQLIDLQGEKQEASSNYELAAEAYDLASKKIPSLKQFYSDYSVYMQAWSQIEQARSAHSIEEYIKAKQHYEEAAELHESTDQWNYLAPNYVAWANMEEAEGLSRRENAQQAKQAFQEALKQFVTAEESMKQTLEEITSIDEKEMIQGLLRVSDLRHRYCQARILLEEAKLLDRQGKYLQSSKSYRKAAHNILTIIEKIDVEAEKNELKLLATLCQAWEKMATAEETNSSESYLEAAKLFEKAKEKCYTRKASLWALGNSSFCKGLAAGIEYQGSLDLRNHAKAKGYMKGAATSYLQGGFKHASEYAKATQRLFDAYMYINKAEGETDPEQSMKLYSMAEKVLQISAGSFMKAKQPEKTNQVQQILKSVREEKALAVSLTEVMHAPTITSSTLSFTAPTPTNEVSVGLESFEHANVQANLIAALREVKVGESFCLSIEFVNAGKEPALLTRVEEFIPPDFLVAEKPEIYRLEDDCLNMKGKQIAPLQLVEAKVVLQASRKGIYQLKPKVNYLDELGQKKFLELKSLEIKVQEVILADRVSTGTKELDSLLLGGIPKEYAVVLTGSPSDEREMVIKNFMKAGIKEGQITFYITPELTVLKDQLSKHRSTYYLFLCNPKPKVEVPDLPNVYRLRGPADLTNLSIALTKAYRNAKQTLKKRVCVEIVSEVLVSYGTITTRKWISELITDLGSKGFTMLAVMDPEMHPLEQKKAVLNLFDGEISLTKTKDAVECRTSIRVEKLRNQDYIRNPICLKKK